MKRETEAIRRSETPVQAARPLKAALAEEGWVAERGGKKTSTNLAEAERVEDLIGVVIKAFGVRVVLDDVLVVPLVRGEEHDHVEEIKGQSVLRAPVDGLVANSSEASAGPAVD